MWLENQPLLSNVLNHSHKLFMMKSRRKIAHAANEVGKAVQISQCLLMFGFCFFFKFST